MARPNLIDLPLELLSEVCSHLCWHCVRGDTAATRSFAGKPDHGRHKRRGSQTDLLSVSRVCRKLHVAAEPVRYHCLCLYREWDLYFLIQTLSVRPDLAVRVLEVEIGHICRVPPTTHGDSDLATTSSAPSLVTVRQHLGSPGSLQPHETPTPQSLGRPTQHRALLSLLFRLALNLERLHLPLPGFRPSGIVPRPKPLGSSLTSLTTLVLSGFEREYLLVQAAPIMRQAPNLEVLHCHGNVRLTESFPASLGRKTLADPPPLQNLTELALTDTFLTPRRFRHLLDAVGPRLSRVSVSIQRTSYHRMVFINPGDDTIKFDEALAALQPWRNTLKRLSFTMSGRVLSGGRRHLQGVHLLRHFNALETLWAQAAFFDLYGQLRSQGHALKATLPDSIRELRLFGYSHLGPALRGLVETLVSGQFPDLRMGVIDEPSFVKYEPESEVAQELKDVAALFQSAGRGFVVRPRP